MRHARLLLLLLALALLLALPSGLFVTNGARQPPLPAAPGFAAPHDVEPAGQPGLDARKHNKRKATRRQQRKAERKERRERQRREQNSDQARIEARVEAAPPRTPALANESNPCGPDLTQLPKSRRCTHGPDDLPPAGSDGARVTAAEARRALANVPCDGDGENGFRVQVLYLRASSDADRYGDKLTAIRDMAAGANTIMQNSSRAAGQEMGFTYVMTPECEIDVQNVVISPSAIRSFDATIVTLDQQGFDRIDRIYLMFADTTAAGICGIGTMWGDDNAAPSNDNNRGPSYARADRICWDSHTAAHELMHNLGGVQRSAPNATRAGHCIDEYDVMCYSDGPGVQMQEVCTPQGTFENLYDCHHDDYFNPLPASGSYLDTHWNTADNWFLTRDVPTDADLIRPDVAWVTPVGNGQTYVASSGVIPLQVDVTDASGVAYVDFWLYNEIRDDWVFLGSDLAAPYTSSVIAAALNSGLNYVLADAYDIHHNLNEEGIWIQRSETTTASAISLIASASRVKARKRVTLTAVVANAPEGGGRVEFRFCRGSSCTWAAGQSLGVLSGAAPSTLWKASGKGKVTFLAQVSSDHGTVTSNPVTVSVKKVRKKRR
ncbi:MAG: hypothetical protein KC432_06720 [Thermomicrobiales bacterium]|nr:hypothetical protein [Thermomicrobiales bacterium]